MSYRNTKNAFTFTWLIPPPEPRSVSPSAAARPVPRVRHLGIGPARCSSAGVDPPTRSPSKTRDTSHRDAPSRALRALVAASAIAVLTAPRPALALIAPLPEDDGCTGGVPQLSISGRASTHAEIVPIFWGSYWSSGTNPSRSQVVGAIQHIVNGPYLAALNQYDSANGIGPARMAPMAPIDTTSFPPIFEGDFIEARVNAQIGQGTVPPPDPNADVIYTVFLQPGVVLPQGGLGFNATGRCDATCGANYDGQPYKVIAISPDLPDFVLYSLAFSNELVGAITQNVSVTNCDGTGPGLGFLQFADLCVEAGESVQLGDVALRPYWSRADNACVVPEGWSGLYQYNDSGTSWTQISNMPLRQIYAGGFGLVATDTSDNLFWYSGTPMQWTKIGNPGAMFAVGVHSVLGLTPDASAVWRYDGSPPFQQIAFSPATAVYAGGVELATDFTGSPWIYDGTPGDWLNLGGPGDQFVVGDGWVAGLNVARQDVLLNPGLVGAGWTSTHHAAAELYAGGDGALAVRDLSASGSVSAMTAFFSDIGGEFGFTLSPWDNGIGGAGNMVALYGSSAAPLAILPASRNEVLHDIVPIGTGFPSWPVIGPTPAGRLVGGGPHLYATDNLTY